MERLEITEDVRKVLLETAEHYEGLAACLRALCSEEKKDEDDGQLMLPFFDEEEEKPVITLEQVRSVLAGKSRDGFTAEVRAIITRHGTNRLSEIKPEDYEAVSLEKSLQEVEETLEGIKGQQITKDNVCRFILKFGKVYKKLSEIDKKKLVRELIESVELYPVEREYGSLIKSITFKFPLNKDKSKFDAADINSCTTENHVETVVLMSRVNTPKE